MLNQKLAHEMEECLKCNQREDQQLDHLQRGNQVTKSYIKVIIEYRFFLFTVLIRLPHSIIYEEYCQCVTNKYLDNELGWQGDQFWSLFNFGELDGFHTNRNYQFYYSNNGRYAKNCNFVQKRSQSSLWVCLSLDWFSWWLMVKTLWLVEIDPWKSWILKTRLYISCDI